MRVARIERASSAVVNIEIADQQWVDSQPQDGEHIFIECSDARPVEPGWLWNGQDFASPAAPEPITPAV